MHNMKQLFYFMRFELQQLLSISNMLILCSSGIVLAIFLFTEANKIWGFGGLKGWIFIITSFSIMVYGFNTFRKKRNCFLKMISSVCGHKNSFFLFLFARMAIIILFLFVLTLLIGLFLPFQCKGLLLSDYLYLGKCFLVLSMLNSFTFLGGLAIELIMPKNISRLMLSFIFILIIVLPLGFSVPQKIGYIPCLPENSQARNDTNTFDLYISKIEDAHFWRPKDVLGENLNLGLGFLGVLILLSYLSFFHYNKRLLNSKKGNFQNIEVKKSQLLIIRGRKNFADRVFIDLLDQDFFYLCRPNELPEIRVGDFLQFICSLTGTAKSLFRTTLPGKIEYDTNIEKLDLNTRSKLLMFLALKKNAKIYLFHDTVSNTNIKIAMEFLNMLEKLTRAGKTVIYITADVHLNFDNADESGIICQKWPQLVRKMSEEISYSNPDK